MIFNLLHDDGFTKAKAVKLKEEVVKMKSLKKLAAMMLSVTALGLMLTGCGGSETGKKSSNAGEPITFTVTADVTGERAPYVEKFAKMVEEKTNGRYKAKVIAAGSLGSGGDAIQMLQNGTLDVLMSDDMTADGVLDGKLGFAWLPGLVNNYEEADKYYNHGWISKKVAEVMKKNDLIRMSSFCNGFRQVGNIKHPVTEMSDLAGLKIRTPSVPSVVSFYKKAGALPVMISGSEVLNALQTGTVDGLDNAVFNYTNQGITDVIKYITELNYCYSGGCFMAGTPFWNKLSDADKKIFMECAQSVSDDFTKFFRDKTKKLQDDGIKSGQWKVDQPSPAMKAAMKEIDKQIWEESKEKYGDEIMNPILSGDYKKLSAAK